MRFFWLLLLLGALVFAITTRHPGVLALSLFVAFVSGLGAVFAFAAARIESTARPDSALLTPEVLAAVRARAAQQRGPAATPAAPAARPVLPPVRSAGSPPSQYLDPGQ
ncbi:MAG: hypothetical protein JNN30_20875 [Rhodanobacteraceae bacterium]|nr:hypothetical protein [Rhodanobacteraceae bacterium]